MAKQEAALATFARVASLGSLHCTVVVFDILKGPSRVRGLLHLFGNQLMGAIPPKLGKPALVPCCLLSQL